MKKEVLIAIVIGLVMGLFITYGFYQSQKPTDLNQTTTIEDLQKNDSLDLLEESGQLILDSPSDESIQKEDKLKVAGTTTPNAFVVIYTNNDPVITQADEIGHFSKEVKLEPLANIISVHSIEEDGQVFTLRRSVVVYDQEITQGQATESGTLSANDE
ncbi:MAG TPA: hypothetical protein PLM16_02615 [Candidatus Woesebacteria bacterium]|nr:hypothetical protein [Candidatus Woesebacteria bacterium]